MSNYSFGDNFAANMSGSSATLSGNNLPDINAAIAQIGPITFPTMEAVTSLRDLANGGIQTGPDAATIEQRGTATRFNNLLNRTGVGILAIVLIAIGIIYLGLVTYEKTTGVSVGDTIKGAAKAAV